MELKIKGLVSKKSITDQYKLVIEHMHGDADGYSQSVVYFSKDEEDMLKRYLEILNELEETGDVQSVDDEITNMGKDDGGLLMMDASCQGELCMPSLKKLTWFDKNGLEYKVSVE